MWIRNFHLRTVTEMLCRIVPRYTKALLAHTGVYFFHCTTFMVKQLKTDWSHTEEGVFWKDSCFFSSLQIHYTFSPLPISLATFSSRCPQANKLRLLVANFTCIKSHKRSNLTSELRIYGFKKKPFTVYWISRVAKTKALESPDRAHLNNTCQYAPRSLPTGRTQW